MFHESLWDSLVSPRSPNLSVNEVFLKKEYFYFIIIIDSTGLPKNAYLYFIKTLSRFLIHSQV